MKPLVSCIIPVYNKEETIGKCVDSVLKQSYKEIEIIIVDDGSMDSSANICEHFAKIYQNVYLISQVNGGVSSARNMGLKVCHGDYITFVDADDTLKENFVEKLMVYSVGDADVVSCSCNAVIDSEVIPQHFFRSSFDTRVMTNCRTDIFLQLMETNYMQKQPVYTGIGVPWGKIYSRKCIEDLGIYFNTELSHYEDNLYIMELLLSEKSFVYVDECLYNYSTTHISSVLCKYDQKLVDSYLRLYKYRLRLINKYKKIVTQEMYTAFVKASLNLFDIAAFTMIIEQKKAPIRMVVEQLKKAVENNKYSELFCRIKYNSQLVSLTRKRRILYTLLAGKHYTTVVLLFKFKKKEKMGNIALFPHNGSANHGCEAIVRSTFGLIKDCGNLILFSERPEEDSKYMPDLPINRMSVKHEITRFSTAHMKALYRRRIKHDQDAFNRVTFSPFIESCRKGVFLSVGGDLYCYETPSYLYKVHRYVKGVGAKSVLWGCSVDPKDIDSEMAEDLAAYDLICARESISYEGLKKINPNTILTVDPAFTLPKQEAELPAEHYIGINISPMVAERETIRGITFRNYVQLIRHILAITDDSVALIPHVVWNETDDRIKLAELKHAFQDEDRVVLVNDMNCLQLKYIISHSRMFIGARTHATIAAYSSCVPTLVVGYSVKAKGIAKDIFGSYENYVLPVQSLENDDDLLNAFEWMYEREESVKAHLKAVMPEYIMRAELAVQALRGLIR